MKKIRAIIVMEKSVGMILALMVVTVSTGIVARYIFNSPLVFADELARYSNIWLTFMGTVLVLQKREYIAIDYVFNKLSPRVKKVVSVINTAIVSFVIFVMFVYGIQLTIMSHIMVTPAFRIPYSYIYIVMPISSFLMIICMHKWVPRMFKGKESEHEG